MSAQDPSGPGLPSYGMLECRIILLRSEKHILELELQDALDRIAALEKALAEAEARAKPRKSARKRTS